MNTWFKLEWERHQRDIARKAELGLAAQSYPFEEQTYAPLKEAMDGPPCRDVYEPREIAVFGRAVKLMRRIVS